ncbi:hypothetical protein K2X89_03160 [Myxococcota bacterium]|nr:hypothetical protein [Myxococcota bacterium]
MRQFFMMASAAFLVPTATHGSSTIKDINQSMLVASSGGGAPQQNVRTGGLGSSLSASNATLYAQSSSSQALTSTGPGSYRLHSGHRLVVIGGPANNSLAQCRGSIGFSVLGQAESVSASASAVQESAENLGAAGRLDRSISVSIVDLTRNTTRILVTLINNGVVGPVSYQAQPGEYRLDFSCSSTLGSSWAGGSSFSETFDISLQLSNALEAPGSHQALPIVPPGPPANNGKFVFISPPSQVSRPGRWFDPPMVTGYDFVSEDGSRFTRIDNFPFGIDGDGTFFVTSGGVAIGAFHPGDQVDFAHEVGASVSSFEIRGIDPLLDATDQTAFPIQLSFDRDAASFSMTPIAVPEPRFGAMVLCCISLLAALRSTGHSRSSLTLSKNE